MRHKVNGKTVEVSTVDKLCAQRSCFQLDPAEWPDDLRVREFPEVKL